MNILLLSWRCIRNPAAGGSELYFHEFAKRWVKEGHRVTWFTSQYGGGSRQETYEGIHFVRRGGVFTLYFFAFWYYLIGNIGKESTVVIDLENGIPFFTPIYIWNKPIILHVHHVHKDVWFKESSGLLSYIGYFLESYALPLIYRNRPVITISKSSAEEILSEGLSTYRAHVINPGIDFYLRKKGKRSNEPTVFLLNRIKKYKGVDVFLKAAAILNKKGRKEIVYWVAGSGDLLEEMRNYAKKNKLTNVKFLGHVSEERKRKLFQKSWIFVNPSSKEGWGIVNIEASYEGTPVVGSDVRGIRDSVVDGETGLLFAQGDAHQLAERIERLVDQPLLRKNLGENGERWAKRFSWDRKAEAYLKILSKFSL